MTEQRNSGEYHRADPVYRRRMRIVLVVVLVLGTAGLFALQRWVSGMTTMVSSGKLFDYERSLHIALGSVSLILGAAAVAFTIWLFRMAAATRAERRWPPSHMRTSADVRIRYLTSADSMVTQMKAGAVGLCLLAIGLIGWGIWLLRGI